MLESEYYNLSFMETKGALIAQSYDFQGFDEKDLSEVQYIRNWPSKVQIRVAGKKPLDNLFCPLKPWFLVSKKVRITLEENNVQGIQFLPINLIHQSGVKIPGYCISNILEIVSGLDYEHTIWLTDQKWNVQYPQLNIVEIALDKKKIEGKDIFRIQEDVTQVFVSKHIESILRSNNAAMGFKFIPVNCY